MSSRQKHGNTIAELPGVLIVLLIFFLFPVVNYATIAIRSGFVFNAAGQAALSASKARSYSVGTPSAPSAVTQANTIATNSLANWYGITLKTISTKILITDIAKQKQTRQANALAVPPNTASNTYQIEVTINCDVSPLITVNIPLFGNIPGITGPYSLSVTQRNYVENSQGLTH